MHSLFNLVCAAMRHNNTSHIESTRSTSTCGGIKDAMFYLPLQMLSLCMEQTSVSVYKINKRAVFNIYFCSFAEIILV